jgi:hypothetical protein
VYAKGHQAAIARGESGEGYTTLLKQARPGTAGRFETNLTLATDKINSRPKGRSLLKTQAEALQKTLEDEGSLPVASLENKIPGLRKLTSKYRNLTSSNWITRLFKGRFEVSDGMVRPKTGQASRRQRRQRLRPQKTRISKS